MNSIIPYICLTGLFLPLVIFFYNRGYKTANRFLAAFFFFASLYVLESFYFFYGDSLQEIAFFTTVHAFFYLIGPFAFLYLRSILRDNCKLSKTDYLHFALFVISFIGYIPYLFSDWSYKLQVAQNMLGDHWDLSQFHLNKILPHKIDQVLNLLHTYFYSVSLWYLLWHYKKPANRTVVHSTQYKLVRTWLLIFASIFTIITINFTVAMANVWIYDDKSIFLDRANGALLFASLVYVGMNMVIMFFPHIMYGLPLGLRTEAADPVVSSTPGTNHTVLEADVFLPQAESKILVSNNELQLFTPEYKKTIETSIEDCLVQKAFLNTDFRLTWFSKESGIPIHHLSYFFNDIKEVSFVDWRNGLRIAHAQFLMQDGAAVRMTLESISLDCGFASQNTFIRSFKNITGTTPSSYLKALS